MSNTILEIKGLSKKYRKVKALDQLNLTVEQGMIFGILGPNGSGKTTTLGILLGVINASGGNFSWFGNGEKDENRKRIGALLETPNFYPYLSAEKNLRIVARIKKLANVEERIEKVLKSVNLFERKTSKFKTFSLGMKQRLAIASALLNDPEILILDEPTNGLDPKGIHEIRQIIQEISKTGTTILLASHLLDEVEKVCDHVIVLQKGKMLYSGPVDEMGIHSDTIIIKAPVEDTIISKVLTQIPGITKFQKEGENWVLEVEKNMETQSINEYFIKNKIVLSHLEKRKTKLEEKFLHLTSE